MLGIYIRDVTSLSLRLWGATLDKNNSQVSCSKHTANIMQNFPNDVAGFDECREKDMCMSKILGRKISSLLISRLVGEEY